MKLRLEHLRSQRRVHPNSSTQQVLNSESFKMPSEEMTVSVDEDVDKEN